MVLDGILKSLTKTRIITLINFLGAMRKALNLFRYLKMNGLKKKK